MNEQAEMTTGNKQESLRRAELPGLSSDAWEGFEVYEHFKLLHRALLRPDNWDTSQKNRCALAALLDMLQSGRLYIRRFSVPEAETSEDLAEAVKRITARVSPGRRWYGVLAAFSSYDCALIPDDRKRNGCRLLYYPALHLRVRIGRMTPAALLRTLEARGGGLAVFPPRSPGDTGYSCFLFEFPGDERPEIPLDPVFTIG